MSTTDSRPDHDSPALLGLGCDEGLGLAPQVGRWRAYCCLLDLHKISTPEEVEEVAEFSRKMWPVLIFETLDDAVAALRGELEPNEEAAELARLGWSGPNVRAERPQTAAPQPE